MHLFNYCVEKKITFTRSRPGHKNDGAHVEQKNWTHVRELVGYLRFDSPGELEVLNTIWMLDGRFTNHLLTQQKLVERRREGAKLIKRFDVARTPVERTIESGVLQDKEIAALIKITRAIRPGDLSRRITALTEELEQLTLTKPTRSIPRIHQAFNGAIRPGQLREETLQGSRTLLDESTKQSSRTI